MKKIRYLIALFSCLALVQISVPLSMIINRETVLRYGKQYRFRTAPVDPYDAFRGRYVALSLAQDEAPLTEGITVEKNQKIYALIENDDQGFARIVAAVLERPQDKDYLQVRVRYVTDRKAHLRLPFDRYYLDENLAPAAETAYRKHSRQEAQDAYVTVRIKSGSAVLEELYIAETPIKEFLQND